VHKALGVKRKYFPRERLSTAFSCRISEQGSCGGREFSSAIRLTYPGQTRHTHDQRSRRTAPNSHADSGGPASQGQAAVPGNLPWPVPILLGSQQRRHSKYDWLAPQRERPVRHGWRLGRIVRANTPVLCGSRSGGGREDMGWPLAKPVFLGQRYADPVCPPTHRRIATCFCDHRGRTIRRRPASIQSVWMPGRSRTPAAESMLPCWLGSS
jgi:hypothetical protein